MRKDWNQVLDAARQAGGVITFRRNGHLRIDGPGGPYFCAATPSDHRAIKNAIAGLRKVGIDVRGRR